MAAFILVRLCTERTKVGRNLKVLAVGDGIGADSIRLASAGFDVHYVDYEESITSKVAAENFTNFKKLSGNLNSTLVVVNRDQIETGTYDAVLSLEVIEHVDRPHDFLRFLQEQLSDQGLLFLSDCFAGVNSYWQTHLLSNERMSGLLPLMAAQNRLAYKGACQDPLYKPYVFQKSNLSASQLITEVLDDSLLMHNLIYEQIKLTKGRGRKIDKLAYLFKRIVINFKGYLALLRLRS
jgi:cyclopropane fatty-acyl-phospholipid synthase-like methyltransferase